MQSGHAAVRLLSRAVFLLTAGSAALLGSASTSIAQTAEEAVLMMAFGLTTELPRDREGHTYLVKKLTNCTYEVTLTGPDKAVMVYLDFSGLHHYSARQLPGNPKLISITMEGKNLMIVKEKGSGKKLGREDAFTNFADQPPDRLEAAASYFRSNFCKGRAF